MRLAYFIANSPHYLPTVLPLIRKTGGILITFNRRALRFIPKEDNGRFSVCRFSGYKSLHREFSNLGIDVLIHPSFSIQYFKRYQGIRHVQVFHGTSDKPFNFHPSLARYDLIAVPGPKMRDDIVERGLASPERIAVIGYPKIDHFLKSNFDARAFSREIKLDPSRKTLLYSPTWDDPDHYSSFARYIVCILRKLREYNIIVKPHPNTLRYRPWHIVRALMAKTENSFIFLKTGSILPFMAVSDMLLTDISSVSHEYLPFNRPLVFLNPMPERQIPPDHTWIWHCGDVVTAPGELINAVEENLNNPDRYKKERENALKQVFLRFDGKAALRFEQSVIEMREKHL